MNKSHFSEDRVRPSLPYSVHELMKTMSMEEMSLSKLLVAESEKIMIFASEEWETPQNPSNLEIFRFCETVAQTLEHVQCNHWLLFKKMEMLSEIRTTTFVRPAEIPDVCLQSLFESEQAVCKYLHAVSLLLEAMKLRYMEMKYTDETSFHKARSYMASLLSTMSLIQDLLLQKMREYKRIAGIYEKWSATESSFLQIHNEYDKNLKLHTSSMAKSFYKISRDRHLLQQVSENLRKISTYYQQKELILNMTPYEVYEPSAPWLSKKLTPFKAR